MTLTEPAGEFAFAGSVSAGSGVLTFSIDNVQAGQWSGEFAAVPWQQSFYYVSSGQHTYTWTYSQGATTASGAAFLDDVQFLPGTTLAVDGTSAANDQFTFAPAGSGASTVLNVALNGESHSFTTAEFNDYLFLGNAAGACATLTGSSAGGDTALLYGSGSGQLDNSSQGYAVSAGGMALIHVNGQVSDTAQFFDSPGNDTFYVYSDYNNSGPAAGMYGVARWPIWLRLIRPAASARISPMRPTAAVTRPISSIRRACSLPTMPTPITAPAASRRRACTAATAASSMPTRPPASPRTSGIRPMPAAIRPISTTRPATTRTTPTRTAAAAPAAGMYGGVSGTPGLGGGYANSASGFATNLAYSINGGSDTAYFFDSQGNATYYAYAGYGASGKPAAGMYGSYGSVVYANAATGFGTNMGNSTHAGSDTAYFYDSQGGATYYAYADYGASGKPAAGMYGSYGGAAYANSASGFATNLATSTASSSDTAYFYDSQGGATYYAYGDYGASGKPAAGMYGSYGGAAYANSAWGFGTNVGNSTGGTSDAAYFYDSPGNDTFYAYADYQGSGRQFAGMYGGVPGTPGLGGGYANSATGFDTNVGYSTGGSDAAYFSDASGTGTFYAYADHAASGQSLAGMYGSGFSNSAVGFATNVGSSTSGSDTAYLYGPLSGSDTLLLDAAMAELYGSSFEEQASGFGAVYAEGGSGAVNTYTQDAYFLNYALSLVGPWSGGLG